MQYKPHTNCRCCNSTRLTMYLDLGMMPMANDLQPTKEAAINAERYPLQVMLCEDCGLSQLSIVVDPEVMFSNYNYRSSINGGYKTHCHEMAVEFKEKYNLHQQSFIIDIAGNDGALLSEFKKVIPDIKHLNVDPAHNLIKANESAGVRQFCKFWGMDAAKQIEAMGWPKADVITATNVFAHVDNVREFLLAAKYALKDDGVLVLEFPYLIDFIEKGEFDTTYFEHLSYWAIAPLMRLAKDCGLFVNDVQKFAIHGGTVRVTISRKMLITNRVIEYTAQEYENKYYTIEPYQTFKYSVQVAREGFVQGLNSLPGTVAAFAASAKGNTLLNSVGDCSSIQYIVDETPEKIGKFSPGTGIEVVPLLHLLVYPVDYLIILSWNFADEIKAKCRAAGYQGKFIIPIPTWEVVE